MSDSDISQPLEAICQLGCEVTRATIEALELGHEVPQAEGLGDEARQELITELKAVMAVYDERD